MNSTLELCKNQGKFYCTLYITVENTDPEKDPT